MIPEKQTMMNHKMNACFLFKLKNSKYEKLVAKPFISILIIMQSNFCWLNDVHLMYNYLVFN